MGFVYLQIYVFCGEITKIVNERFFWTVSQIANMQTHIYNSVVLI